MDPRIGILMKEGAQRFYAFVDGYQMPAFEGTREAVEERLGLRPPAPPAVVPRRPSDARPLLKAWDVTMHFQHPAWDEVDGILYRGITARSKSEANKAAARQALSDGHAVGGRGRYWFSAVEAEADETPEG